MKVFKSATGKYYKNRSSAIKRKRIVEREHLHVKNSDHRMRTAEALAFFHKKRQPISE